VQKEYSMLIKEKKREWADSLLKRITEHPEVKTIVKGNYNELVSILTAAACKNCDPPQLNRNSPKWTAREDLIYANFLQMLADFPGQKFYGQFGNNHIYLKPPRRATPLQHPFASRLNTYSDSPVKGKVCSIMTEYTNGPREFTPEDRKLIDKVSTSNFMSGSNFTLIRLGEASPFSYASSYFEFLVINRFYNGDELRYNKTNDHYGYIENENYTVSGITLGYQRWSYQAMEVGYTVSGRDTKKYNYFTGFSLFFELDPGSHINTYRASVWGGNDPLFIGISPAFTTDYKHSAFFLRPEIGLKKSSFSLTYSYNLKIYNKEITRINKSMITFRVFLPLSKN
jgi:hypothetical protein